MHCFYNACNHQHVLSFINAIPKSYQSHKKGCCLCGRVLHNMGPGCEFLTPVTQLSDEVLWTSQQTLALISRLLLCFSGFYIKGSCEIFCHFVVSNLLNRCGGWLWSESQDFRSHALQLMHKWAVICLFWGLWE